MRKRSKTRLTVVMIIASIFLLLTGCSKGVKTENNESSKLSQYELENFEKNFKSTDKPKNVSNNKKIVVGFSMDSLKEPIWKKNRDLFISKVKELGGEVRVEEANSDDKLQLSQIDKLIAEGVNVLVVAPHDGVVSAEAVDKAHAAGIKIIAYDRLIKNSDVDLYIAIDNLKVGELQATEMLKKVSSGNIAYVGGSQSDNNAILFREGAMKVLSENKNINIVMDKYSPDWKADEAYKNVMDLLSQRTDISGIVCANDGTASGAIAALEKFNLAGKVYVTGLDSEVAACQRIVEGTQLMTIYKPVNTIAEKAAELAVKMAKGENIETNNKVFNGKVDVPSYLVDPIVVNKDNMMDTVIKDGFNKYEDVYKNVPEDKRPKQ